MFDTVVMIEGKARRSKPKQMTSEEETVLTSHVPVVDVLQRPLATISMYRHEGLRCVILQIQIFKMCLYVLRYNEEFPSKLLKNYNKSHVIGYIL